MAYSYYKLSMPDNALCEIEKALKINPKDNEMLELKQEILDMNNSSQYKM